MKTKALAGTALLSHLWLCLSWFDHGIDLFLARSSPVAPAVVLASALVALAWTWRKHLFPTKDGIVTLGLVLLAFVTRVPFLFCAYGLFSSDAAAQGVMALHILEGRHHPIFLYNWSYVGSFKAILAALLATVFGDPVVSFALAAIVVYAAFAGALYLLARTVLSRGEALAASLYVIFSPGFLTGWGMGNEGNYLDVMLLGTLMLAFGARWMLRDDDGLGVAFTIGVLGGIAFWIHILATYYLLAALGILLLHRWRYRPFRRLLVFVAGFLVGDFPGILWNAGNDWLSFRWWSLEVHSLSMSERLGRAATQLTEVFTTSFGVLVGDWPPNDAPWPPALWSALLSVVIPASVVAFAWRHRMQLAALRRGELTPHAMLVGFALLVVAVFAQSSFGWMTAEPRYLLFLFSVVPLFLASALFGLFRRSRWAAIVVVAALLAINVRGDAVYLRDAFRSDPINREFVSDLESLGLRHFHSDYHLSYKYVFLSHGRTVWTSELGPSQTEWYFPFREEVEAAETAETVGSVALVPRSFRFARRLERHLDARGISYRREDLLYPVLFDFSEPIHPRDLR
jgi:hypothetical protein